MSVPTPHDLAAHVGALQAEVAVSRAARLAACCTPGGLARARAALSRFVRHGNLAVERACCPWPV